MKITQKQTQGRSRWAELCLALNIALVSYMVTGIVPTPWNIEKYFVPTEVHAQTQEMTTQDYVLSEVEKAGINKYDAYALIKCESKWNPEATLVNKGGQLGIDRGLWQINTKFHPEVSNSCAYNVECSTKEAIRIIKKHGFKEWSCSK